MRPQIGIRPECIDIKVIDHNLYNNLFLLPDAAMTTDSYLQKRRYEYDWLFKILSDEEKTEIRNIYRDNRGKVGNIQRGF